MKMKVKLPDEEAEVLGQIKKKKEGVGNASHNIWLFLPESDGILRGISVKLRSLKHSDGRHRYYLQGIFRFPPYTLSVRSLHFILMLVTVHK